ncbi:MAG: methionine adenosyltransferase, partial [Rhodospirillaceae bacterium]|nr:methionine adenosyltransferase [Rhodospirillaceae bacterium]
KGKKKRLERAREEAEHRSTRGSRKRRDLEKPIYERTAAYGHFGRAPEPDGGFSWERLDLVDPLKSALA